jgi:hypothetical protein
MQYREIAERRIRLSLNKVTLFVLEDEWERLRSILDQHGPAEITAVRPLCRFSGLSVDVLCSTPDAASELLGRWHDNSVDRLCYTIAADTSQRNRGRRD